MATNKQSGMGKTKRSTDDLINDAIAKQNDWLEQRRSFTRSFLKNLNVFAKPSDKNQEKTKADVVIEENKKSMKKGGWKAYWFPILCAVVVACIAGWVAFFHEPKVKVVQQQPVEHKIQVVEKKDTVTKPTFDIVRIEKDGNVIVAGRWLPRQNVSIRVNGKVVATEITDSNGEFVYSPVVPFKPGNYTVSLLGVNPDTEGEEDVFLYISEQGYKNSVSLLMTKDGSTLLQLPSSLQESDLVVSKIDYLDTGRIVVSGDALPRLRVSLSLNDKYIGFAKVSDYKHFGLGADVGQLETGKEYTLTVRLHDGDGRTVASVVHKFVMPEMTGDDNTYYTVRKGDCLWIIARNFMRRGVLFSIIAERNNIENPDLIFPKQLLQIPVHGEQ